MGFFNFFSNVGVTGWNQILIEDIVSKSKINKKWDLLRNAGVAVVGMSSLVTAPTWVPVMPLAVTVGAVLASIGGTLMAPQAFYNIGELWSLNKMSRETAGGSVQSVKNRMRGLEKFLKRSGYVNFAGVATIGAATLLCFGMGFPAAVMLGAGVSSLTVAAVAFGALDAGQTVLAHYEAKVAERKMRKALGMAEPLPALATRPRLVARFRAAVNGNTPAPELIAKMVRKTEGTSRLATRERG